MGVLISAPGVFGPVCREFLTQSELRNEVEVRQPAHSPKEQPLPSAASIRPLLMKASALLANVSLHAVGLLIGVTCSVAHLAKHS